ncbi:MAG: hypothetical protein M1816_004043 [Peltula sp. TS41687]|nr:MAG: hypothetical protein M1816_004043 [Peltula sp. TS41687]
MFSVDDDSDPLNMATIPTYNPAQDLPGRNASPTTLHKYVNIINQSMARFEALRALMEHLGLNESTANLYLIRSTSLHAQLFCQILDAIIPKLSAKNSDQNNLAYTSQTLWRAKGLCAELELEERRLLVHHKSLLPVEKNLVPDISPLSLGIWAVIQQVCPNTVPDEGSKERREAFLDGLIRLKALRSSSSADSHIIDGSPRTIAVCVGTQPRPHISIGETKPIWLRNSFLQWWSIKTRELRLSREIETIHQQFQQLVEDKERTGLSRAESLVEVGCSPGSLVNLDMHTAQAIDGSTMETKDRCPQCRKTFGYGWLVEECPLREETVVEWAAKEPGKCAENWLWQTCIRITHAKKDYLVKAFGLNPANIFSSRDASFLHNILKATNGEGVERRPQLADRRPFACQLAMLRLVWPLCGDRLKVDRFLKNATFTAFDMSNLYNTDNSAHHALWSRLLGEVLRLYREKNTDALRYYSSRNRMGKVAISLENHMLVMRV